MRPVVQTVSRASDTSRDMIAVYGRSMNFSVTYCVKCSSCSDLSRPVKKMNFSSEKWHDNAG
jgi:hypothetical protein